MTTIKWPMGKRKTRRIQCLKIKKEKYLKMRKWSAKSKVWNDKFQINGDVLVR